MKLAIPDVISPSYFPAAAAIELGFFKQEGLDVTLEHIRPVTNTWEALRDGQIEFVGASAHAALSAFPEWKGVKLLCAQGQGMYWFLVMRSDIGAKQNDLSCVKGRKIGAAPWIDLGLRRLLQEAGIDTQRDNVDIVPIPPDPTAKVSYNFGVIAAKALEDGKLDGFWANGMGCEVAVRKGVGVKVLDIRRGDGPPGCFDYTFSSIATTEKIVKEQPDVAAAAIRAIVNTHKAFKADPNIATKVGEKLFPPEEAAMIAELIRRDLPIYDASISEKAIAGVNKFSREMGILKEDGAYDQIVATQFSNLWKG